MVGGRFGWWVPITIEYQSVRFKILSCRIFALFCKVARLYITQCITKHHISPLRIALRWTNVGKPLLKYTCNGWRNASLLIGSSCHLTILADHSLRDIPSLNPRYHYKCRTLGKWDRSLYYVCWSKQSPFFFSVRHTQICSRKRRFWSWCELSSFSLWTRLLIGSFSLTPMEPSPILAFL